MPRAFLGLGSNQGDRLSHLTRALKRLDAHPRIQVIQTSPVYETEPVGVAMQPLFLNGVAAVETVLAPAELWLQCDHVERLLGRDRSDSRLRWGPRTIDIDLLHYEGYDSDDEELKLPHPRILERRFVLQPLADIAPDLVIAGATVREHLANLSAGSCGHDPHAIRLYKEGIDYACL